MSEEKLQYPELKQALSMWAADRAAKLQAARLTALQIDQIDQRIHKFLIDMPPAKFRAQWLADQIDASMDDVTAFIASSFVIDLDDGWYMLAADYANLADHVDHNALGEYLRDDGCSADRPAQIEAARLADRAAEIEAARLAALQIDDSEARIKAFMDGLPVGDYSAQFVVDQIDVTLTDVMCVLDGLDDAPDFGYEFHVHASGGLSRYWDGLADDDDDLADDDDYWDKERCVECSEVIHGQNFEGLCEACHEYYTRRDDDLADDTGHADDAPGLWPRYRELLADLDASDTTKRLEIAYRLDGLINEAKEVIAYRADLFTITARPDSAQYAIIINPKKSVESVTLEAMSLNDLLVKAADHLLTLDRP